MPCANKKQRSHDATYCGNTDLVIPYCLGDQPLEFILIHGLRLANGMKWFKLTASNFEHMIEDQAIKLKGPELLARLKELGDLGKKEKCHACGYYSFKRDGTIRYNFTALYAAIAEANGVELKPKKHGKRTLAYRASVLTTGAVLVGTRYIEELGLRPGDQVVIQKRAGKLVLEPVTV